MQLRGHNADDIDVPGPVQRARLPEGALQELDMHDGVHPGGEHHRLRAHTQVLQHHEHRRGEYSYSRHEMKCPHSDTIYGMRFADFISRGRKGDLVTA